MGRIVSCRFNNTSQWNRSEIHTHSFHLFAAIAGASLKWWAGVAMLKHLFIKPIKNLSSNSVWFLVHSLSLPLSQSTRGRHTACACVWASVCFSIFGYNSCLTACKMNAICFCIFFGNSVSWVFSFRCLFNVSLPLSLSLTHIDDDLSQVTSAGTILNCDKIVCLWKQIEKLLPFTDSSKPFRQKHNNRYVMLWYADVRVFWYQIQNMNGINGFCTY